MQHSTDTDTTADAFAAATLVAPQPADIDFDPSRPLAYYVGSDRALVRLAILRSRYQAGELSEAA